MVAARVVVLCVCVTACKFGPPAGVIGDAGTGDEGQLPDIDAADAPDSCTSWNAKHFMPCAIGSPMPEVHLVAGASPYVYDTTTSGGQLRDKANNLVVSSNITVMQPDASVVAVLDVERLVIDPSTVLRVIGTKPLLVASWDTITVAGAIDAGSHGNQGQGAGATAWACTAGVGQPGVSTGGSGGGGGGGMRGMGGAGGEADDVPGPLGGLAGPSITAPTVIRPGCHGGSSGAAGTGAVVAPSTATTTAAGGATGGALELAARVGISISGTVVSGGGGGLGAPSGSACGGGGGGSGGYLGFDSPSVQLAATTIIAANGGGGGASAPFAGTGGPGMDGQPSMMPAPGGMRLTGSGCGVSGTPGGAGGMMNGGPPPVADACGGSGGGGGVGFVLVWSAGFTKGGALVSPGEQLNVN